MKRVKKIQKVLPKKKIKIVIHQFILTINKVFYLKYWKNFIYKIWII